MPADVFFVTGEASGDLQAALLARAIRALRPNITFAGAGGDAMRRAGVRVVIDSTEFGGIGHLAVLARAPAIYLQYVRLDAMLRARPPRLLVPIDSGAVNLRLLGRLRRRGFRGDVVYYVPPGAWLDDAPTAQRTASFATPITLFAHQRDFYRSLGLPIEFFGHPLSSVISPHPARPLEPGVARIAILPGSRAEEVGRHLPIVARAAVALARDLNARFEIIAASDEREAQIRRLWARNGGPADAAIVRDPVPVAVTNADVALSASGTAVLEVALRAVPQVAFYAVSDAIYRLAKRRLPHIVAGFLTLPNLILGREVVEELKQRDFTPERLVASATTLLRDERARQTQLAGYAELRSKLGPPDALTRIAAYIVDRIEGRRGQ